MSTTLITRETAGGGATVKDAPLTNAEIDSNFISLSENKLEASSNLADLTDTTAAKANLDLATLAFQNSDNVDITGGTIVGITDLAVADGGTGASDPASARANLELGSMSVLDAGEGSGEFRNNSENDERYFTQDQITSLLTTAVPAGVITMWSGNIVNIPTGWALCDGNNGTPNLTDKFIVGAGNIYAVGDTGGSTDAIVVQHTHGTSTAAAGSHTHTANSLSAGSHTHGGNTSNAGSHTHGGNTSNTGNHSHTHDLKAAHGITTAFGGGLDLARANNTRGSTNTRGAHSHNISTNSAGAHTHNIATDTAGSHTHTITVDSIGNHTHDVTVNSVGSSGTNANLPPYYALAYIMKI